MEKIPHIGGFRPVTWSISSLYTSTSPCAHNTSQWVDQAPVLGQLEPLFHLLSVGATGGATHTIGAEYATLNFWRGSVQDFFVAMEESISTTLFLFPLFPHNMLHSSVIQISHLCLGFSIWFFPLRRWRLHTHFQQCQVHQAFLPFKVAFTIVYDLAFTILPSAGFYMMVLCVIWHRSRI